MRLHPCYTILILHNLYIIHKPILFKLVRDVPLNQLVASSGPLTTLFEKVVPVGIIVVLAEEIGMLQFANIALSNLIAFGKVSSRIGVTDLLG